MNSLGTYQYLLKSYQVTYRLEHSLLMKTLNLTAYDTYQATMIVRNSLPDATIVKIVQVD